MTGMRKNNFRKWTAMAEIDLQKRRRKPVLKDAEIRRKTEMAELIREVIIVEGRDDIDAVQKAVSADIIATHGYGISAFYSGSDPQGLRDQRHYYSD